jgi:pyruvate formate lyase activating enzyme
MLSRRQFLVAATHAGMVGSGAATPHSASVPPGQGDDPVRNSPRARYWISSTSPACAKCHDPKVRLRKSPHTARQATTRCQLCAQECILRSGEKGKCRARMNVEGEMRSLVYGRPLAIHVDPIEKKPFYHFLPGSTAFSLGTAGCPLRCKFCQNWEISQSSPEDHRTSFVSPAAIVDAAARRDAPTVAFTYNEPTVFVEYLSDIAGIARKQKVRTVLISCGFMNSEPLTEMCSLLDAIKIDLKGFSEEFYRDVCGASLVPVLRSIKQISRSRVHLEIVNLVVPTLNDSPKMLEGLADWIVGELGPDIPVHFTRFHPDYQLRNLPPTPVATLERARDIALRRGIRYPFVGNVPDHAGNHTYCPGCGKIVIRRSAFFVLEMNVGNGRCRFCEKPIPGVWT